MKRILIVAICICIILIVFPTAVHAASVVLSWDSSTVNTDGTPLTDLDGYKVHYGTEPGNYSISIDVGNVITYQIDDLLPGTTYYFAATAYDTTGNESKYSTEISKTTPMPVPVPDTMPPAPPPGFTGLILTIEKPVTEKIYLMVPNTEAVRIEGIIGGDTIPVSEKIEFPPNEPPEREAEGEL